MKIIISILMVIILIPLATAATLQGSVYNSDLELEQDVLVSIDTIPVQKILSDGTYTFDIPIGTYVLTAKKENVIVTEDVEITGEGSFVIDLFLIPGFTDEDDLWSDTEEELFDTEETVPDKNRIWSYVVAGLLFLFAAIRLAKARKKYGPLRKFRKKHKEESRKSIEQHKEEIASEPGYLDEIINLIKKHDGRISQKKLRHEMLHLSEAKISLILTELEHKGMIEKVKKGRGNVILLK